MPIAAFLKGAPRPGAWEKKKIQFNQTPTVQHIPRQVARDKRTDSRKVSLFPGQKFFKLGPQYIDEDLYECTPVPLYEKQIPILDYNTYLEKKPGEAATQVKPSKPQIVYHRDYNKVLTFDPSITDLEEDSFAPIFPKKFAFNIPLPTTLENVKKRKMKVFFKSGDFDVKKPEFVNIDLQETETIFLLEMPGSMVLDKDDNYEHVLEKNAMYLKKLDRKASHPKAFSNEHTQTIENHKEDAYTDYKIDECFDFGMECHVYQIQDETKVFMIEEAKRRAKEEKRLAEFVPSTSSCELEHDEEREKIIRTLEEAAAKDALKISDYDDDEPPNPTTDCNCHIRTHFMDEREKAETAERMERERIKAELLAEQDHCRLRKEKKSLENFTKYLKEEEEEEEEEDIRLHSLWEEACEDQVPMSSEDDEEFEIKMTLEAVYERRKRTAPQRGLRIYPDLAPSISAIDQLIYMNKELNLEEFEEQEEEMDDDDTDTIIPEVSEQVDEDTMVDLIIQQHRMQEQLEMQDGVQVEADDMIIMPPELTEADLIRIQAELDEGLEKPKPKFEEDVKAIESVQSKPSKSKTKKEKKGGKRKEKGEEKSQSKSKKTKKGKK